MNGYKHGPIECRSCFIGVGKTLQLGDWILENNPGYYGSENPKKLVLGFSKGLTQNRAAQSGDFDKIAFAGMRDRLQRVLGKLGLMPTDRSINNMMTANENEFGFASLVRCSLCKRRKTDNKCITSGAIVTNGFGVPEIHTIIRRCVQKYLSDKPESLLQIILLGTNQSYVEKTKQLFRELYTDYKEINAVAFRARGAIWLYVAHPSPANGNFNLWIDANPNNPSGRNCILAQEALAM